MAERGGQPGNDNAAKGAQWRNAIERIVNHWPNPPEQWAAQQNMGLHKMAFLFVSKMVDDGDISFFKEFGDRLDGKPKQQTEITGPDGSAVLSGVTVKMVKPS